MSLINPDVTPEKDFPLRDDIRLLGRILGDTIREQEGEAIFEIVERIRQTSIRFHRDEDEIARRELETILNSLSRGRTNQIIRAYSYFSHLANLAEDQHHVRRSRAHAMAGVHAMEAAAPREGTLARALKLIQEAGISHTALQAFFGSALVCPVLTAHPTEVRRKSTIDREMEISQVLARRDRQRLTPEEEASCRGIPAPRHPHALADEHSAPEQAEGDRRGHERPVLLRQYLLQGIAARLRLPGGPARGHGSRPGTMWRSRPSCAWGAGSAAIATAIPS